jgi:hypothetical protein
MMPPGIAGNNEPGVPNEQYGCTANIKVFNSGSLYARTFFAISFTSAFDSENVALVLTVL